MWIPAWRLLPGDRCEGAIVAGTKQSPGHRDYLKVYFTATSCVRTIHKDRLVEVAR
jgi:hypothetical protein